MRQYPVRLKDCVKCIGDLTFEEDHFGKYYGCLQCGQHYYFNGTKLQRNLPRKPSNQMQDVMWRARWTKYSPRENRPDNF